MKRQHCWGIKRNSGGFVQEPLREYWQADRTLLFRTKKQAEGWLNSNLFWNQKAKVVRITFIVKEYGE